ncbi:MAG: Na+/H+ antiporter NhaA [Desulforhopalus sp.]|nr:Na+/H+ antiporter NhaA [Desulforhopalus sp.]
MTTGLSKTFTNFFNAEKWSGILLILCTVIALLLSNSSVGPAYLDFWRHEFAGLTLEHWVNDGLMAVFFLFVGLELEREMYNGELANFNSALLPIIAAVGGICVPALIHYSLNAGTAAQPGAGIPMATDIAFALGVLALLGDRIPASLKIFLTALAVIDDLGAIIVIAVLYTAKVSLPYLFAALGIFILLLTCNTIFRITRLAPYLLGGALLWFCMLKSGVHATIAGVLLAFAIPFSAKTDDAASPSHRLEHFLQKPVAFAILPIFALANTGIIIDAGGWQKELFSSNGLGIIGGLVMGKPLGISLFCLIGIACGICRLPGDLRWQHILGAGFLGGIGFTMSIFITNLAFAGNAEIINSSKMAILLASFVAGLLGALWLAFFSRK